MLAPMPLGKDKGCLLDEDSGEMALTIEKVLYGFCFHGNSHRDSSKKHVNLCFTLIIALAASFPHLLNSNFARDVGSFVRSFLFLRYFISHFNVVGFLLRTLFS